MLSCMHCSWHSGDDTIVTSASNGVGLPSRTILHAVHCQVRSHLNASHDNRVVHRQWAMIKDMDTQADQWVEKPLPPTMGRSLHILILLYTLHQNVLVTN